LAEETTSKPAPEASPVSGVPESGTASGQERFQEVLDASKQAEEAVVSAIAGITALDKNQS